MADDNLIQAALGALEGFSNAYLPYMQRKQESDLLTQRLGYENRLAIAREKMRQAGEFENAKNIIPYQRESKIAEEEAAAKARGEEYRVPYENIPPSFRTKIRAQPGGRYDVRYANPEAGIIRQEEKNRQISPQDQREIDNLDSQINELSQVQGDVAHLRDLYDKRSKGIAGGIAEIGSKVPVIGGAAFPDTKTYDDTVNTTALNVQRVLTKTGRAFGGGMKAESIAFPTGGDTGKKGYGKFDEVSRKLNDRIEGLKSLQQKIYNKSGNSNSLVPTFPLKNDLTVGGSFNGQKILKVEKVD